MSVNISVDVMGGDFGLQVTIPAALSFLHDYPDAKLVLVGDEPLINTALTNQVFNSEQLSVIHTSQIVGMDESPQSALKSKKDSSMRRALDLVKEGETQAAVSAGNTGALMATARFVLKTLPGIERPAIAKLLPNKHSVTCALDLGANIDSTPERLAQFAIMGTEFMTAVFNIQHPSVGLLNIGTEDIKGNEIIRTAAELFKASKLNYYGYVEGNDFYEGTVDVIVTDGFTGNVALKASEGLAHMISSFLKEEFTRDWKCKLAAFFSQSVLNRLKERTDIRRYNGASLLGLKGCVIKSHGGTDKTGFYFALVQAYKEVSNDVINHISQQIEIQLLQIKPSLLEINKDES